MLFSAALHWGLTHTHIQTGNVITDGLNSLGTCDTSDYIKHTQMHFLFLEMCFLSG